MVSEERVCRVPCTTCTMEPYCVTYKVYRQVPVCVPVCEPVCPPPPCCPTGRATSNAEWFARTNDRARAVAGVVPASVRQEEK
jgi:hypothetical protein